MLKYTVYEELKSSPEEHPVLLTETPMNSDSNRLALTEIMFQNLNVPCLYVQKQEVLALYASDKTTGLVLNSGEGITHVVPVYEGFAVPHAIQRANIAGQEITEYLRGHLRDKGHKFANPEQTDIVRRIKETM